MRITTKQYSYKGLIITVEGPFTNWYYSHELGQEVSSDEFRAFLGNAILTNVYEYGKTEEEVLGKIIMANFRCSRIEEL